MISTRMLARTLASSAIGLAMTIPLAAAPAHADVLDLSWDVDTTTTLKKIGTTVSLPTGSLVAQIDSASGAMTGDLTFPTASKTLSIGQIPLADVSVALHQAAPVTGSVDLDRNHAAASASFDVQVVAIRPTFAPAINLVSGSCTTQTPATASLRGPINLGGSTTFSSSYALPKFEDCGRTTTKVISTLLSGPKNTMQITLS